jgi:predicted dehydrogenase
MSKQSFNVVVVGCGAMANAWIDTALKSPGVTVVGLVDVRRAAAEAKAEKYELPKSVVFDTLAEAIKQTGANLVFDVTIPDAHEAVVTEALKLGCDVLGEKPLAATLPAARRMVDAARRTGRTYAVMQNRRWTPEIIAFRNVLHGGRLGALEELHADMFVGPHFGGFREEMKFPLLLDMAIHTFDEARFLSGADPVSVYCHSYNPRRSWYGHDASAICVFELSDGMVFTYRGSWCAEGLPADWNGEWRAIGSRGTATWDGKATLKAQAVKDESSKDFFRPVEDVPVPVEPLGEDGGGHAGLIRDYFACLRAGRTPATVCTDNIKSLAMVEAAVESAKSGKKVKVEW